MIQDIKNADYRKLIIREILGAENKRRKEKSEREMEIYDGHIEPYVTENLDSCIGERLRKKTSIYSSINLLKRITDDESKLYLRPPKREVVGADEDQARVVDLIYEDMQADSVLLKSSRAYTIQGQNLVGFVWPESGPKLRSYRMHRIDVIPEAKDPERMYGVIISSFNQQKYDYLQGDGHNQKIADKDDPRLESMEFTVWTAEDHFKFNGKNQILSEDGAVFNPIGMLNFIDISDEKDFQFFIDRVNSAVQFTIDYNSAVSREDFITTYQGFAQPYFKGPIQLLEQNEIEVGVDVFLKVPTDGVEDPGNVDIGFINPGADLSAIRERKESLLKDFLISRGINPETFVGSSKASSGIEQLLTMVKEFDRSIEDRALYENAEKKLFKIVANWHKVLSDANQLPDKYKCRPFHELEMNVTFEKPEMIQTQKDLADLEVFLMEKGLQTKQQTIANIYKLNPEEAEQRLLEMEAPQEVEEPEEEQEDGNQVNP